MTVGALRKPLLLFCLAASIALHIGAVWFLYFHPFAMEVGQEMSLMKPSPNPKIVPKEEEELFVEKIERALEESLNSVIASARSSINSTDIAERNIFEDQKPESFEISEPVEPPKILFASQPKVREEELAAMEETPVEFFSNMPPLFDPELGASLSDFALEDELESPVPHEVEKFASVDLSDQNLYEGPPPAAAELVIDDYTMSDEQFSPTALPIHGETGLDPKFIASLEKLGAPFPESKRHLSEESLLSNATESTTPQLILPNAVDYLRSQWVKRSLAQNTLPDLDYYGLDTITSDVEWEEDLDIDVALMPAQDGSGKYVFSLTVQPEFAAGVEPMPQNFYFLIDRSSSIEKHKFSRFKRAVQRALAALHEGDRFNIYVFDKNVSKLSQKTLAVTPKTIEMAESFLEEQSAKTHFASTEVYSSLESMLPSQFDTSELHSVILITDGNTLLNSQKQKKAIGVWSDRFKGDVNFYAAAAGKGNNLVLLDLLSYSTAGKMLYSDTNAGFPRKLVRLVKDLHYPVVKNLTIDAQPAASTAEVHIYPHNNHLPPLFAGQEYTIMGTIDELCDLTLFIQGKNRDKYLNIRKEISLRDAMRGGRSLEKKWAITQAKICYDHFLKNGKSAHLKEAVQIVTPYRGVIASEQ